MNDNPKLLTGAAIALILVVGLIHLIEAPSNLSEAAYKGVLFILNGFGAFVAAAGIYRGQRTWGWGLGFLIASGAFVAYVVSRTIGLPSLPVDIWMEPIGILSLIVEGSFAALALIALTNRTTHELSVQREW